MPMSIPAHKNLVNPPAQSATERMSDYHAISIAEGMEEARDEQEIIDAWQHLVNTGLAWTLQGSFGRKAAYLIEEGVIHATH